MIERNNNTSDTSEHNIEDISPALSKINKNNGFVVPNGYFEQLSSEIQQRCVNSPKESWIKFVLSSFTKPKYILRYSFILVLLFFGTYFLFDPRWKINQDYPTCWVLLSMAIVESCFTIWYLYWYK